MVAILVPGSTPTADRWQMDEHALSNLELMLDVVVQRLEQLRGAQEAKRFAESLSDAGCPRELVDRGMANPKKNSYPFRYPFQPEMPPFWATASMEGGFGIFAVSCCGDVRCD